jgi:hypothetical protein
MRQTAAEHEDVEAAMSSLDHRDNAKALTLRQLLGNSGIEQVSATNDSVAIDPNRTSIVPDRGF